MKTAVDILRGVGVDCPEVNAALTQDTSIHFDAGTIRREVAILTLAQLVADLIQQRPIGRLVTNVGPGSAMWRVAVPV